MASLTCNNILRKVIGKQKMKMWFFAVLLLAPKVLYTSPHPEIHPIPLIAPRCYIRLWRVILTNTKSPLVRTFTFKTWFEIHKYLRRLIFFSSLSVEILLQKTLRSERNAHFELWSEWPALLFFLTQLLEYSKPSPISETKTGPLVSKQPDFQCPFRFQKKSHTNSGNKLKIPKSAKEEVKRARCQAQEGP